MFLDFFFQTWSREHISWLFQLLSILVLDCELRLRKLKFVFRGKVEAFAAASISVRWESLVALRVRFVLLAGVFAFRGLSE